jgi:hypothetical protein
VAEQGSGKGPYKAARYYGYSPRILCTTAPIKSQPLISRCVRLDICPTSNPDMDKLDRSLRPENSDLYGVRDMLYRLQLGRWSEVQRGYQDTKTTWRGAGAPRGRVRDKWLPIMALADLTGDQTVAEAVKELAGKDTQEFAKNQAESMDAYLMQFAGWLVADGSEEVTGTELWGMFTWGEKEVIWAHDLGYNLETEWLKRGKAGGSRKLVSELQRLKLLSDGHQTSKNTFYTLDRDQVYAVLATTLGTAAARECKQASHTVDLFHYRNTRRAA